MHLFLIEKFNLNFAEKNIPYCDLLKNVKVTLRLLVSILFTLFFYNEYSCYVVVVFKREKRSKFSAAF